MKTHCCVKLNAMMETIAGQPSWRVQSTHVEAFVSEIGGHVAPVRFHLGERVVEPFHIAPWNTESAIQNDPNLPPITKVLRGDFFCLPFGGNDSAFQGEAHPPHGETANAKWNFESLQTENGRTTLRLDLQTSVRAGRVEKQISLVDEHAAIYSRHIVSQMSGPMNLGHHAMLRFPDSGGVISTSRLQRLQTSPLPMEIPPDGDSLLQPGALFDSLRAAPTVHGDFVDLSRYPAREGFEDLVMLCADPSEPLAWTAVCFVDEGYVWFSLKDARVLRSTILWFSNRGREYSPWNGRHLGVLGLEEVTSYFHFGLDESAQPNPVSNAGIPTIIELDADKPLTVNTIMACAALPPGFGEVARISAHEDGQGVRLESVEGVTLNVALDVNWLW